MKKFLSLLLVAALCLSLVGCGMSEEDVIGLWTYDDNESWISFELRDDGTYVLLSKQNGRSVTPDRGTYTVEHGLLTNEVVLKSDSDDSETRYTYRGGSLYNNSHEFTFDGDSHIYMLD